MPVTRSPWIRLIFNLLYTESLLWLARRSNDPLFHDVLTKKKHLLCADLAPVWLTLVPCSPFLFFLFTVSYKSWGMYPSCLALYVGAQHGVGLCLCPLEMYRYSTAQLFLSDSLQCLTQNSLCRCDPLMHADLEKPPKVANVTLLFNSKDAGNWDSFA